MKEIELTKGYVAQVDDDLYDWLGQWNWHVKGSGRIKYAVRGTSKGGVYKNIFMHREILQAPDDKRVDHINHDGLCNLRSNLRLCTPSENQHNKRSWLKGSSKYLGVSARHSTRKGKKGSVREYLYWTAGASRGDEKVFLGSFNNEEDAAMCYDMYAMREYGEFANLNFPEKRDDYLRGIVLKEPRETTSQFTGVCWSPLKNKWQAYLSRKGKNINLGFWNTEEEAAMRRDIAAMVYYGDGANFNFPERKNEYVGREIVWQKRKEKSSQFLGVGWHKSSSSWRAWVKIDGKDVHLSHSKDEITAAETRDLALLRHYGPGVILNFPNKINDYLCKINKEHEEGVLKS